MKKSARAWSQFRRMFSGKQVVRGPRDNRRERIRFELLEPRLALALSPTDHIHPYFSIFLDGQQLTIPNNLGITDTQLFNPHVHDSTGKIHVGEDGLTAGTSGLVRLVTMKDFFDVWRTQGIGTTWNNPNAFFDSTHLMDKTADAGHVVRMYVNGVPNTQFENFVPNDGDRVVLSYESVVSAGTPLFAPIETQTVLGGSPLFLPVDGFDAEGNSLIYTISTTNPSLLAVSQAAGNQSLKLSIQQQKSDNTTENFGDMVFQLFQDLAPRPANRVAQLASSGFYNGTIFHRVIDNFVIQGGDPTGTGSGGSPLGNFDDQFHVDLQHNRTGLLSFAKSSDDTNNSQFFVTEGPQRHLDFNHSIFGVLTEGENVRDRISNVAVTNSRPVESIVISSATVFSDNQNTVFKLKAAEGATGSADVTITATDSTGKSFSRTFRVNVTPDTSNGGPFLNDIAAVRTTVNQPVTFQLTSQDVEGNAVAFTATSTNSSATVSVSPTCLVSVTPPTGFTGTLPVNVSVRAGTGVPNNTGDASDVQLVNVTVAPATPGTPDLANASDTGSSNTDNRTNLKNGLQFLVSGVANGATVELREGSTVLGSAIAGATGTVAITTNVVLNDGAHNITAVQTLSGAASNASSALTVNVDSAAPTFSSTAPTQATVGTLLTYDANVNETVIFSLVNPPSGATIDANTGIVTWTPSSGQSGTQSFGILATDTAGNGTTQTVTLSVADGKPVQFRLEITNTSGNPLSGPIDVGTVFDVRMFAQDLRTTPDIDLGVFSAYMDITFDPLKAERTSDPLVHSSTYSVAPSPIPETATAGLIDEFGGTAGSLSPLGGDELLVGTARFRAKGSGLLVFEGNPADNQDQHGVLLYGLGTFFPNDQVRYGIAFIQVQSAIGANADTFSVEEDSTNNSLNVLANDKSGGSGTLTVTGVSATTKGGVVAVASGGKAVTYTPAPNFTGTDQFTYTVQEGSDTTTATVDVQVSNVNDAPVGKNDSFTFEEDTPSQTLDVLGNDTDIDPGDSLRVLSFTTPSKGGIVSLGNNGLNLSYRPAPNFVGTETFTYTLADRANLVSTATVTLTITEKNDPPQALNDVVSVDEDSQANTLNVLSNDTDVENDPITITAVGSSTNSTISVSADKKSLLYTPNKNFAGSDSFTYTVTDGTSSSQGTVFVTVKNSNDPPTAVNDTLDARKNSAAQSFNLLANDSSFPDADETLTITAVSAPSSGGSVTIAENKLTVNYAPAKDFVGEETFTYTISDGNGGTATATASIKVLDFIPSSLSGSVFMDRNNDGIQNDGEVPIAGVKITLSGTDSISNKSVQREVFTDNNGVYQFADLAPGTYNLIQTQPAFINDGLERVGSQGGTIEQNDQIRVTLPENVTANNYSFAERGRPARFLTLADFTARNNTGLVYAAVADNQVLWTAASTNTTPQITSLAANNAGLELNALLAQGNSSTPVRAILPYTDTRLRTLAHDGSSHLYAIAGSVQDLNFQPITNGGSGEGESTASAGRIAAAVPIASTAASSSFTLNVTPEVPALAASSLPAGSNVDGVFSLSQVTLPVAGSTGSSADRVGSSDGPAAVDGSQGLAPAFVDAVMSESDADRQSVADESEPHDHLHADAGHLALDQFFASW